MNYKRLATVTRMKTAVGARLSYTYTVIDKAGQTTAENQRGALTLTGSMTEATDAVNVLDDFLTARLPKKGGTPVLKSWCIFNVAEGTRIVYMYDTIDKAGRTTTRNNQGTLTLLQEVMADKMAAAAGLRAWLEKRL